MPHDGVRWFGSGSGGDGEVSSLTRVATVSPRTRSCIVRRNCALLPPRVNVDLARQGFKDLKVAVRESLMRDLRHISLFFSGAVNSLARLR